LDIDAIQQGTAHLGPVPLDLRGRAAAFPVAITQVSTGAGGSAKMKPNTTTVRVCFAEFDDSRRKEPDKEASLEALPESTMSLESPGDLSRHS
jgi:hypothetical protein